ncbi:hypothetical protein ACI6Q2_18060 [Chitinophagaceae bacterium LWZ2-11]
MKKNYLLFICTGFTIGVTAQLQSKVSTLQTGLTAIAKGDSFYVYSNYKQEKKGETLSKVLKIVGLGLAGYQSAQTLKASSNNKSSTTSGLKYEDLLIPLGATIFVSSDKLANKFSKKTTFFRYTLYNIKLEPIATGFIKQDDKALKKKGGIIFSGVANEAGYIKITQENATGTELSDNKPILHLIPSEEILQEQVQEDNIDIIAVELERIQHNNLQLKPISFTLPERQPLLIKKPRLLKKAVHRKKRKTQSADIRRKKLIEIEENSVIIETQILPVQEAQTPEKENPFEVLPISPFVLPRKFSLEVPDDEVTDNEIPEDKQPEPEIAPKRKLLGSSEPIINQSYPPWEYTGIGTFYNNYGNGGSGGNSGDASHLSSGSGWYDDDPQPIPLPPPCDSKTVQAGNDTTDLLKKYAPELTRLTIAPPGGNEKAMALGWKKNNSGMDSTISYVTTDVIEGGPTNFVIKDSDIANMHVTALVHTHSFASAGSNTMNLMRPSAADFYVVMNHAGDSDFQTSYVLGADGSMYALTITDRNMAKKFLQKTYYAESTNLDAASSDFKAGGMMQRMYDDAYQAAINVGQDINTAAANAMAYALYSSESGISLLKADANGDFKMLRTAITQDVQGNKYLATAQCP